MTASFTRRRARLVLGLAAISPLLLSACGGRQGATGAAGSLGGTAKAVRVEVGRNVARVPGISPPDVAAAAILSAYSGGERPSGWILVPGGNWRNAVLAAQFAAKPVSAGIVPIKRDYLPTGPADVLSRLRATGFPKAGGLRAVVLGKAGTDVFVDLQDLGLKLTQLNEPNPAKLAGKLVPFRGGWAKSYSSSVVVVSSDARDYALPAAAWSAYSGDTVAFVSRRTVPAATAALLAQRQKLRLDKPSIYVVGPRSVISDAVLAKLAPYGPVTRIAGADAAATSVALARYKDRKTGFGWGLGKGPVSVSLVNPRDWGNAVAALSYAARGPQAPILLTRPSGEVPASVSKYLERVRGSTAGQGFVFGDAPSIPSKAIGQVSGMLDPGR